MGPVYARGEVAFGGPRAEVYERAYERAASHHGSFETAWAQSPRSGGREGKALDNMTGASMGMSVSRVPETVKRVNALGKSGTVSLMYSVPENLPDSMVCLEASSIAKVQNWVHAARLAEAEGYSGPSRLSSLEDGMQDGIGASVSTSRSSASGFSELQKCLTERQPEDKPRAALSRQVEQFSVEVSSEARQGEDETNFSRIEKGIHDLTAKFAENFDLVDNIFRMKIERVTAACEEKNGFGLS